MHVKVELGAMALMRSSISQNLVWKHFQRSLSKCSCICDKNNSSELSNKDNIDSQPDALVVGKQNTLVQDYGPTSKFVSFRKRQEIALATMEEFEKLPKMEEPFRRTGRILKDDLKTLGRGAQRVVGLDPRPTEPLMKRTFPTHTDVVIIGGGAMGSSIAYWMKQRVPKGFHLVVIERDNTYTEASTSLSVGGLRQQFSLPESIEMSLFGADFLRTIDRTLAVDGYPPPNVNFEPYGYLFLSGEATAPILQHNSNLQRQLGAKNELLSPEKLRAKFPWLNTDGVAVGCLGLEKEGWFDPWSLLNAFKRKAINLGAEYINGEVVGFEFKDQPNIVVPSADGRYEQIERVVIRMANGEIKAIKFAMCIIAAGAYSGEIAKMARMGDGDGILAVPLPIEPRKRFVYCFHCPGGPGLNTPLTIDPTGTYFRREGLGGNYIGGVSPLPYEEPPTDDLDVDYDFFDERVWPVLAQRVPAFEKLKLRSGWAGFYEYNVLDQNGVVGRHPLYHNLFFATGFSGHGIQHAPAVGRAMMELLLDGGYKTIDLSRMGFDRHCVNEPLQEHGVV